MPAALFHPLVRASFSGTFAPLRGTGGADAQMEGVIKERIPVELCRHNNHFLFDLPSLSHSHFSRFILCFIPLCNTSFSFPFQFLYSTTFLFWEITPWDLNFYIFNDLVTHLHVCGSLKLVNAHMQVNIKYIIFYYYVLFWLSSFLNV